MNRPQVSVVMGYAQAPLERLLDSIASVLAQQGVSLECLVVLDGPPGAGVLQALQHRARSDRRLRVLLQPHAGLTRALIRGCRRARGVVIARIDVGDRMLPGRLQRQWQLLQQHPDCVLVTCGVRCCGPAWEPLDATPPAAASLPAAEPQRVDTLPPARGIAADVPHHGSVLLRRSAYRAAGGYRSAFYFAQDWDLWYRLALMGRFGHCPEPLYACRLFATGLSSRHWREQRRLAALALALYGARWRGASERALLAQARLIRPVLARRRRWPDRRSAEGAYFIGERLRRLGDRRCRTYLLQALLQAPWLLKSWLRLLQAAAALP
ncbi:MAG: glycosyltransferase [Cyanobacteriota bacterium]|nr:glycosyltransferase [Cyanobacteriota bacterium]